MARIAIDPLTRIEGHLRIEAEVDGGQVSQAWSSGTMFRGMEMILRGRDPREAWIWAQRICGVCTTVHALASVRAVEDALGVEVPDNARLVRNLIAGSQHVQDHVIHFYHLHALDWVDVIEALKADPAQTSRLAQSISDWPNSGTNYFAETLRRLRSLEASGQLSLFTSGYWGHPAYRLPPEANLMAVAHYLEALEFQREVIRIHAILGGKNPHPQTYLVGGMASAMDPNEPTAPINMERLSHIAKLVDYGRRFVEQVYVPDVLAIAGFYPDYFEIGEGVGNFLAYGGLPGGPIWDVDRYFLPRGVILGRDLSRVLPFDPNQVMEHVARSWFEYEGGETARHPFEGETNPRYTGPAPPYDLLNVDEKYSWLKAPRLDGRAMEVGPLSRMLVAYARGHEGVRTRVDGVLVQLGRGPEALFSTLGRVAARAVEAGVIAEQMEVWLAELTANLGHGNLRMVNDEAWDPDSWPRAVRGFGAHAAPRGSLGHWVEIVDKRIANYQVIAPTTWNGCPRDSMGQPSPYEASLPDTPIANAEQPLEILRTIHSFDPCLACAVHTVDGQGRALARAFTRTTTMS